MAKASITVIRNIIFCATLFFYQSADCQCTYPKINGQTSLCKGQSTLFVSNNSKINWYTDTLKDPIYTGIIFVPEDTELGTHTYFANQEGCTSSFTRIEFTIFDIPQAPDENILKSIYNINEVSDENLFDHEYSWYIAHESPSPFFIGSKLPDTLSVGQHQYFIATENVCKSEKTSVHFAIIKDQLTISGCLKNIQNIKGKAQLVREDLSITYQTEIIDNSFILISEKSGNYYVRILPYESQLYSPTYFGNKTDKKDAYKLTVTDSYFSGLDIYVQEKNVGCNYNEASCFVLFEDHLLKVYSDKTVKELTLFSVIGKEICTSSCSILTVPRNIPIGIVHVVFADGESEILTVVNKIKGNF